MGLREEHFAIFPSIFLLFCLVFHWSAFNVGEVTAFFFFSETPLGLGVCYASPGKSQRKIKE